ncbi:MAG TPA: TIGR03619 family F420-dependent LLM class oxidoreductase [Chloroflexota bacterium]|nr:TIGR03619 family F420-dependent LLM class oxidoreductase [Chloroflexota bacterium]
MNAAARHLELSITAEGAMYPPAEQHRLLDVARAADQLGVDYIDTTDHVLMGEHALTSGHGWLPHHLEMPIPEPLTTLAVMAGATQHIKLLSAIVIAPLRPAGLLAKIVATLHALSRGRFVLGVSTSWQKDEYDALGVPFDQRGQVLEDTLGACRALWGEESASFQSRYVHFENMHCQPRPAPGDRIPIWFGGKVTPRLIRRTVNLGDGWMPFGGLGMSLPQKAAAIALLKDRMRESGRSNERFDVCDELPPLDGSIAKSMEQVPAIAATGASVIRVHLRRFSNQPDDVLPALEEIVHRFAPYRDITVQPQT